jgi:hypothetical protein
VTTEKAAYSEPPVRRKRLDLDAMERPCVDCEVGEPHACPLLRYDDPSSGRPEGGESRG